MPVLRNSKHEKFAQLIARGETQTKAYVKAGYSETGADGNASRLIGNDRISARIEELQATISKSLVAQSIAIREARVRAQNDRWLKMHQVIAERGADPAMAEVPGGPTGLLVHHIKQIGGGEFAERVDEYEVDAGLLRELREHEMLAAKELGQWSEKVDVNVSDVDAAIERELARLAAAGKAGNARAPEGAD